MTKKNPHRGTTLDAFLDAEGIREAAKAEAVTRVVAWQLSAGNGTSGHQQGDACRKDAHQPRPGRSHPEGQGQHDGRKPAARGRPGRQAAAP